MTEETFEVIEHWLIESNWDEWIKLLWENEFFINVKNPYRILRLWNQYVEKQYSNCTIFWQLWESWFNCWFKFTQSQFELAWLEALNKWVTKEWVWWWFVDTQTFVQKHILEKYWIDSVAMNTPLRWETLIKWLNNDWWFAFGSYFSKELIKDMQDNWIIDWIEFPSWSWHLMYMVKLYFWETIDLWDEKYLVNETWIYVINSYNKHYKYNITLIKDFKWFISKWPLMNNAYILLPKKIIMENTQLQEDIVNIKWAIDNKKTNWKLWEMVEVNWVKTNDMLTVISAWLYPDKIVNTLMLVRAVKPLEERIKSLEETINTLLKVS